MTVHSSTKLPEDKQADVHRAYMALMCAGGSDPAEARVTPAVTVD